MDINLNKDGSALAIALKGRLDTTTAPELDAEISNNIEGITAITFDFAELEYISSAGLRTLLATQKKMNAASGTMVIKNANSIIKEAFEITGFMDILTVE